MGYEALDDFAGPGGWDEGARMIGLRTVGIEWDEAACQTAKAAGHDRIRADVAVYPSAPFIGIPGYIASPPCQAWSMAGKRGGELDRANCHVLADRMAEGDDSINWTDWEDPRSALVCQPVRRVREMQPEWIALEEVPAVLGLWLHFGRIFRSWGYSVWVNVLCAADYGVPQTRERCILMASRSQVVGPPWPTHSPQGDWGAGLFGEVRKPWVTMYDALGRGLDEPAATVSSGGAATGGWEPFANADYRRRLRESLIDRRTNSKDGRGGMVPTALVATTRPAPTLTGKGAAGQWLVRHEDGDRNITIREATVLQSFRPDYPWQGNKGKQGEQIGNAVPPLLAAHILSSLTGRAMEAAA